MILGYGKIAFVLPFIRNRGGHMASLDEILSNTTQPMAVSGITKLVVPSLAQRHGLDWYYIDGGYMGNHRDKIWFRVTRNARQDPGPIRDRPDDRLRRLNLDRAALRRGSDILLVPPDPKVAYAYGLGTVDSWIARVSAEIGRYTQRRVQIRQRPASRVVRTTQDRFQDRLAQDVNAVVVYNSIAGVESVINGIPVVCLGENAATTMSGTLDKIDNLPDLDPDRVRAWMCHLSYCQFTRVEMLQGRAWDILHG